MFTRLSAVIVIVVLAAMHTGAHADDASHRQAVERLFGLTAMQQKINGSVANILAIQLAQSPELRNHGIVLREFLERYVGWDSLKDALTRLYMQPFSEQELDDMNTFYGSPTGRKVIERLPVLVQQRNHLAMKRLSEHMGELREAIDAENREKGQPSVCSGFLFGCNGTALASLAQARTEDGIALPGALSAGGGPDRVGAPARKRQRAILAGAQTTATSHPDKAHTSARDPRRPALS